jgi:hypothetical protein
MILKKKYLLCKQIVQIFKKERVMKQKLNIRKGRIAIMTVLLLLVALVFTNVNVYSKNAEALDSGTVACLGGGKLDCLGFAAQVIIWIY